MDNPFPEAQTFVTHLECGMHHDRYEADQLHGLSQAGKPLLVKYDLDALAQAVTKEELASRPATLWRYREFLPVRKSENIVSLGEVHTPLIPVPRLQGGKGTAWIKDEGRLPTGSFKARGLCMAVSMAKELGPQNIHVAHLVIDAGVDTAFVRDRIVQSGKDPDTLPADTLMNPKSVAETYWHLYHQPRDGWTFEMDLRPYGETW